MNDFDCELKKITYFESLLVSLNAGYGNGALIMPYIFFMVGNFWAITLLAICGYLCWYAWCRLMDVLDKQDNQILVQINLLKLVRKEMGVNWETFTRLVTFTFLEFTCIAYYIFIQQQLIFMSPSSTELVGVGTDISIIFFFYIPFMYLVMKENLNSFTWMF
jgi:amino acid permease